MDDAIRKKKPVFLPIAVFTLVIGMISPIYSLAQESPLQTDAYHSPFAVNLKVDIPLIVISGTLTLMPEIFSKELPHDACYPCDPNTVNRFDRTTIDMYSKGAATASDIVIAALPLSALGISLVNLSTDGQWKAVGQDFVLLLETLAITTMMMQLTKHAFDRPRPYMYQDVPEDDRRKHSADDVSSFYSGHTALAFATATAMSYMFSVRHPEKKVKYAVWSVSLSAATAVGLLRVFAGKHFWTDVITGAVVGGSTGIIVPALHRVTEHTDISLVTGPGNINVFVAF